MAKKREKKKDSVYTPLGLRTAASALYDSNIFTHSCHEIRCGLEDAVPTNKKIMGKYGEIPYEWRF